VLPREARVSNPPGTEDVEAVYNWKDRRIAKLGARVKELEEATRECLSLIDKDASTHARPTVKAVFAVQSVLKRALCGEGDGDE